jgi:hypothetical protein
MSIVLQSKVHFRKLFTQGFEVAAVYINAKYLLELIMQLRKGLQLFDAAVRSLASVKIEKTERN